MVQNGEFDEEEHNKKLMGGNFMDDDQFLRLVTLL